MLQDVPVATFFEAVQSPRFGEASYEAPLRAAARLRAGWVLQEGRLTLAELQSCSSRSPRVYDCCVVFPTVARDTIHKMNLLRSEPPTNMSR